MALRILNDQPAKIKNILKFYDKVRPFPVKHGLVLKNLFVKVTTLTDKGRKT